MRTSPTSCVRNTIQPRAMLVKDLAPLIGMRNSTSLQDNYWLRCMGLNDRTGKHRYHDNRLHPSPLVLPVRAGGPRRGLSTFRFRARPLTGGLAQQPLVDRDDRLDFSVETSGRWPDQDDLRRGAMLSALLSETNDAHSMARVWSPSVPPRRSYTVIGNVPSLTASATAFKTFQSCSASSIVGRAWS